MASSQSEICSVVWIVRNEIVEEAVGNDSWPELKLLEYKHGLGKTGNFLYENTLVVGVQITK